MAEVATGSRMPTSLLSESTAFPLQTSTYTMLSRCRAPSDTEVPVASASSCISGRARSRTSKRPSTALPNASVAVPSRYLPDSLT